MHAAEFVRIDDPEALSLTTALEASIVNSPEELSDKMVSEVDRWKSSTINAFFVETADENYLLARWSFLNRLYGQFYWNALHAIEKYLKASLCLNGRPVGNYKHDILQMYGDALSYSSDLLPAVIVPPTEIRSDNFRPCTAMDFVESIGLRGDSNNRYAYWGYGQRPDDLFKLDALVFSLRRITVDLDHVDLRTDGEEFQSWREVLLR
jgi:hypothetical protein